MEKTFNQIKKVDRFQWVSPSLRENEKVGEKSQDARLHP